jgi:tetratricopeptide (TPR) repeat protein
MAARVNTKIVIVLVLGLLACGGMLGALLVLRHMKSPERNYKIAEQYVEQNDDRNALRYYMRAIGKDAGNRTYLMHAEEAVLRIVPESRNEANEMYSSYIRLLGHSATHFSNDPDVHLKFIHELYTIARLTNTAQAWRQLRQAGTVMYDRVPSEIPARHYGQLYRAIANTHLVTELGEEGLEQACTDLQVVVDAFPENDLAWFALISAQNRLARHFEAEGRPDLAEKASSDADLTISRIQDHGIPGPRTYHAIIQHTLVQLDHEYDESAFRDLQDTARQFLASLQDQMEPILAVQNAERLVLLLGQEGRDQLRDLLAEYWQQHPEDYIAGLELVKQQLSSGQFETARSTARSIIDAPKLSTCFLAAMQQDIRKQAATQLADIAFREFELADEADKQDRIETIRAAINEVRSFSDNPDNDSYVDQAEGKLAFALEEFDRAAARFESIITRANNSGVSSEIYLFASAALEQLNQLGPARERLQSAIQSNPTNYQLLLRIARLDMRLRNFEQARVAAQGVLQFSPENEDALHILEVTDQALLAQENQGDEISTLLRDALQYASESQFDSARSSLAQAETINDRDLRVLVTRIQVEVAAQNLDQASVYLTRGLEIYPDNPRLLGLRTAIETSDPLERLELLVQRTIEDETEQMIAMLVNLKLLVLRYEQAADRFTADENTTRADEARSVASRAQTRLDALIEQAKTELPDEPGVVDFLFQLALEQEDWAAARQYLATARAKNLDQVDGLIFQGRLELAQQDFAAAIRSLEEATIRKGYSSQAWEALAYAYRMVGNLSDARRSYAEAYRCAPNNVQIMKAYVRLLVQLGDKTRALLILRQADRIAPGDVELREMRLSVEEQEGDEAVVLQRRLRIYQTQPNDTSNAIALARLLTRLEPSRMTILTDEGDVKYNANAWARLSDNERQTIFASTRREWMAKANEIINALDQAQLSSLEIVSAKADVLAAQGRLQDGADELRAFIDSYANDERTPAMYLTFAEYFRKRGDIGAAVRVLEEGLAFQSADRREIDNALSAIYFSTGRYDNALEHLLKVQEVMDDSDIDRRVVECLIGLGRFDQAQAQLDALVGDNEPDYLDSMLHATLLNARAAKAHADGQSSRAQQYFDEFQLMIDRAKLLRPTDVKPHMLQAQALAQAYLRSVEAGRENDLLRDDALLALDRAEQIQPDREDVLLQRVLLLRSFNMDDRAIALLEGYVNKYPDADAPRAQLIDALAQRGRVDRAITLAEDAIDRKPSSAAWHERLGNLYFVSKRDAASAIPYFLRSLEIQPTRALVVRAADAMLSSASPDHQAVIDLIASHDQYLAIDPLLCGLYAQSLEGLGRHAEALTQLRSSYTMFQDAIHNRGLNAGEIRIWFSFVDKVFDAERIQDADTFTMELCNQQPTVHELRWLARLWYQTGTAGADRARALMLEALDSTTDMSPELRIALFQDLGTFQIAWEDYDGAVESYKSILEIDPNSPETLNNLAYLTVKFLGDAQAALPYAQRAVAVSPDNAAILDTLGWILFQLDRSDEALEPLKQAVRLAPSAATYVHLAEVKLALDDIPGAETDLRAASRLNPDADTQAEIQRLADDIRNKRSRAG